MNIYEIEELLIKSVHSNKEAEAFFLTNLQNEELFYVILEIVEKSTFGDARMEGAYYLSKYDENILKQEEGRLLLLLDDELDSVAVHIMIALSRMGSLRGLEKIIKNRIKPILEWEAQALENYVQGVFNEK